MTTPSSLVSTLSAAALEETLDILLNNNFDADSQSTLMIFIKILDNILTRPGDLSVCTLKLSNATIQQKIVQRKGAIPFLIACGFVTVTEEGLLHSGFEEKLVWSTTTTDNEQFRMQHLLTARRLLQLKATRDLKMDPKQLPRIPQIPNVMTTANSSNTSTTASSSSTSSFNPYQSHRVDAQALVTGISMKPDNQYISPTEAKLRLLQEQQAKLEREQQSQVQNHQWMALMPGQAVLQQTNTTSSSSTSNTAPSDSSLIAQRLQQQQAAAKQREHFTTKAMRDLKELEKKRVYAHVTLTIQFPNSQKLVGMFAPKTTIAMVKRAMIQECCRDSSAVSSLELFITPPRRVLHDQNTLDGEGLVPAAKVFCTTNIEIRPELFTQTSSTTTTAVEALYPVGQSLTASNALPPPTTKAEAVKEGPKKVKLSREEKMLQRMMGGGK